MLHVTRGLFFSCRGRFLFASNRLLITLGTTIIITQFAAEKAISWLNVSVTEVAEHGAGVIRVRTVRVDCRVVQIVALVTLLLLTLNAIDRFSLAQTENLDRNVCLN